MAAQLRQQKAELDGRIVQAINRVERAQRQLEQGPTQPLPPPARSPIAPARSLARPRDGDYRALGAGIEDWAVRQAGMGAVRQQLDQAQAELASLQRQEQVLRQTLAFVELRACIYGAAAPPAEAALGSTVTTAPAASAASESFLLPQGIADWVRKFWVVLAAAAVALLGALTRLRKGRLRRLSWF